MYYEHPFCVKIISVSVRTGVGSVGKTIAGEAGAQIAITTYDIVITASNLYIPAYATKKLLQQSGILAIKVPVPRVLNNPKDPFTQGLRAPGVVSNYCISIPQNGYGKIQVIPLPNGYYMLADGHHPDVFLPCGVGGITLVVQPVAADDADGIGRVFYEVDDFFTGVGGHDVGTVDGFAVQQRVDTPAHGA